MCVQYVFLTCKCVKGQENKWREKIQIHTHWEHQFPDVFLPLKNALSFIQCTMGLGYVQKIIAIQSCDGCDYLRRDLKGIELLRGGSRDFFFFLDESEHKRFLSPRASPLSKILHILQLESIYIYTCVNVCACMCMEIGRGRGREGWGRGGGRQMAETIFF